MTVIPTRSRADRRPRRGLAVALAGALAALGVVACEPPPPPDGRDLGVVLDGPLPTRVEEGAPLEVTGTVTNHGSVAADGVTLTYAVDGGFTADDVSAGAGATCAPVTERQVTCSFGDSLAPAATLPFTLHATAGTTSGPRTHVVAATSAGSEPAGDVNPSVTTFTTDVRPPAADPVLLAMGGGRNHLGTANLLGATWVPGLVSEGLALSVNPFCTDKANGDRFQSGFANGTATGSCTGTANPEYRSGGYTYVIDVPAGRTSDLRVLLWDARYANSALPGGEAAIDSFRQAGTEPFTFTLYAADATPADDTDNPVLCSATFDAATPFDAITFLGSQRWNELCTISTSAPSGWYLLRVRNGGAVTSPLADGSNQFGVVAAYTADGFDAAAAICDRATDPLCPAVSGDGETSLYVSNPGSVAQVVLGRVPAAQEGRQLEVELFDPGEGGSRIRLFAPTGPGTWAPTSFSWSSPGVGSGADVTSLQVTNNRFNDRLVTLTADLAGYVPPAGNDTWLVVYEFLTGGVTDRTTWSATVEDVPAP